MSENDNNNVSLDEINDTIEKLMDELKAAEFQALGGIKESEEKVKLIKSNLKNLYKLKLKTKINK